MEGERYKIVLLQDGNITFSIGHYFQYSTDMKLDTPKLYPGENYIDQHFQLISTAVKQVENSETNGIQGCKVEDENNDKTKIALEIKFDKRFVQALNVKELDEPRVSIKGTFIVGFGNPRKIINYSSIEQKLCVTDFPIQEKTVLEDFEGSSGIEWARGQSSGQFTNVKIKYDILLSWSDPLDSVKKFDICEQVFKRLSMLDCAIIARNQVEVPCHSLILSVHSEVLNNLLMTEVTQGYKYKIEMQDISEAGVRAFLRYLYIWDISEARKCDTIAMEQLKLAEKYKIKGLQETMLQLLSLQQSTWFQINTVLELYILSGNVPEYSSLASRMLAMMKSNPTKLSSSTLFMELKEKYPATLMDLTLLLLEINC